MQSPKLNYQKWVIAVYLANTGIEETSSMKLHRDLWITQKSGWHPAHRIRRSREQPDRHNPANPLLPQPRAPRDLGPTLLYDHPSHPHTPNSLNRPLNQLAFPERFKIS